MVISFTGVLSRLDNLIFDIGQKLYQSTPPADVIIVAIDENSLAQLGRWPWSRKIHADLLNRLKLEKPSAIGLDIVFSEADKTDLTADTALANTVQAAGNVVLPVLLETTRANGQLIETLPLPALTKASADLGRVHAVLDEDGIARNISLFEGVGASVWQHFSQAVINVAEKSLQKIIF